jgi:hypothetical protein
MSRVSFDYPDIRPDNIIIMGQCTNDSNRESYGKLLRFVKKTYKEYLSQGEVDLFMEEDKDDNIECFILYRP